MLREARRSEVDQQLAQQFQSTFVRRAILVIQGLPRPDSEEGRQVLLEIDTAIKKEAGVSGTFSYLDWSDPIFLGQGGGTFIIIGLSRQRPTCRCNHSAAAQRAQTLAESIAQPFPGAEI